MQAGPTLAASALLQLGQDDFWPVDRWREALQAWSDDALKLSAWNVTHSMLISAPDSLFQGAAHSLIRWLQSLVEIEFTSPDDWTSLLETILRIFRAEPTADDEDPVGKAINHPVGQAVQALLDRWYQSKLEDNQLLPDSIKDHLTDEW